MSDFKSGSNPFFNIYPNTVTDMYCLIDMEIWKTCLVAWHLHVFLELNVWLLVMYIYL